MLELVAYHARSAMSICNGAAPPLSRPRRCSRPCRNAQEYRNSRLVLSRHHHHHVLHPFLLLRLLLAVPGQVPNSKHCRSAIGVGRRSARAHCSVGEFLLLLVVAALVASPALGRLVGRFPTDVFSVSFWFICLPPSAARNRRLFLSHLVRWIPAPRLCSRHLSHPWSLTRIV